MNRILAYGMDSADSGYNLGTFLTHWNSYKSLEKGSACMESHCKNKLYYTYLFIYFLYKLSSFLDSFIYLSPFKLSKLLHTDTSKFPNVADV
jgi:hypothetical protein